MSRTSWLYLENGYMPWIWRGVGFCLTLNALVAASFAATARPYFVPPLSIYGPAIALSHTAFNIYIFFWLGAAFAGFPMMFGSRRKFWPAFGAVSMIVLGLMEYTTITCSFIVVTLCYLLALLFDKKDEPNPTARLIQIACTWCYIASGLHKIHPEWLSGETMIQIFHQGWNVYPGWMPILDGLNISLPVAQFLSIFTVIFEIGLGVALWVPKVRKLAAIGGILFHASLTLLLSGIIPFMPTMLVGYLAFFKNKAATAQAPRATSGTAATALAFVAIMLLAPFRFAVLDKPAEQSSFFDWAPWSMAMFLYNEKVEKVVAQYRDSSGVWHDEPAGWRMLRASSDKDLRGLAHYLLLQHQDATEAKADCSLLINSHWQMEKICTARRENGQYSFAITQK